MTENAAHFPPPTTPVSGAKDSSTRLIIMGALLIAGGVLCGLMALLMPVAVLLQRAVPAGQANAMPAHMMVTNLLFYSAMAVVGIWLGIGSIKARRWARALILTTAWIWLICGLAAIPFLAIFLPKTLRASFEAAAVPAAAIVIALIAMGVVCFVMYIVIPGMFILCYRSPHVKATCELRNPAPSWTDSCPLPLLAMVLVLGGGAITLPMCAFGGYPVPFFGRFICGWAAVPAYLLAAGLVGVAAIGFYRRQVTAWWGAVVMLTLCSISFGATIAGAGFAGYYQGMGLSASQVETYAKMMGAIEPEMLVFQFVWSVAIMGYLVWLRRYFVPVQKPV